MAVITANGIVLPDPRSITIDNEVIWSEDTGRTLSGLMTGDVIAEKITISLKWNTLSDSQMATIKKALKSGFFNITFYDAGETLTLTVYRGTLTKEQTLIRNGKYYYENVSVDLVQR